MTGLRKATVAGIEVTQRIIRKTASNTMEGHTSVVSVPAYPWVDDQEEPLQQPLFVREAAK